MPNDASNDIVDTMFTPPRRFVVIGDAAKDGNRQLLKAGPNYAVAQWTGTLWSYPYDPTGQKKYCGIAPEEIDFEPTHYSVDEIEPIN